MRQLRTVANTLVLGLIVLGLPACMPEGPSAADRLENDMEEAAMSAAGIDSADVDVTLNTSGNFITAKLVGTGSDEAALADALEAALPAMLEKTEHLQSGSFSTSIFSPDDTLSVGADALGFPGGNSLRDFQEFFLGQP